MTRPVYDLGSNFFQSHEDIIKKDDEDLLLQKNFQRNEEKIKDDFKIKISNLASYYKTLNDQYNFSALPKKQLLEKVTPYILI